jgi:16S rRNA (uracil1498-N3)-methyltransferase
MSRRFFVPAPIAFDRVTLDAPLAQRLAKVLRLRAGDAITLFDGSGEEARARIERIDARGGEVRVLERFAGMAEPRTAVHLYQSITKGERFEWLIEKATELGVAEITPLVTARSVVKTTGGAARVDRWRRIAVEAAEQCGRGRVPSISAPARFTDEVAAAHGVVLLPFESAGEAAPSIRSELDRQIDWLFESGEVSVFVGPEGGFEDTEVTHAVEVGAAVVTMGRRVLRSETAGLVALTLVMQAIGELG